MDFCRLYIEKELLQRSMQQLHLFFDKKLEIYVNMLKLFEFMPIYNKIRYARFEQRKCFDDHQ